MEKDLMKCLDLVGTWQAYDRQGEAGTTCKHFRTLTIRLQYASRGVLVKGSTVR